MNARNEAPGLTKALAQFTATLDHASLAPEIVAQCKRLILDCLGNQVGAFGETAPTLVYEAVSDPGATGASTIVGWGTRASPMIAGLVNGTLAHTLDMDDAHRDSLTKTGSAITPAALAVAEAVGATGAQVIAAVVAGYETMIRLGLAVNPSHRQRGFHSTATLGAFGAAVTAGRLMGLTPDRMASALGVAGTQSAGLAAFINNPSMIKPLNVGRGVQSGILAATLAARGFIGPEDILEGSEGFLRAYTDGYDVERLTGGLGERFHLLECGYKPHAACRYAHGPIDAALELMAAHGFAAQDIAGIDVHVSELAYRQSDFHEPASISSAQGSAPFSIASGITQRARSLTVRDVRAAFEDDGTWRLHRRIRMHVDPGMDYMGRGCRLTLRLASGQCLEAVVTLPRGEPENPMSPAEIRDKFDSQAVPVVGQKSADALADLVDRLDEQPNVAPLMRHTKALSPLHR